MILEKDLESINRIYDEIKQINFSIEQHAKFGKFLHVSFMVPRNGSIAGDFDEASVAVLLQLNEDEIHKYCNIMLNDMLQHKLAAKRLELKELGFTLDGEKKFKRKPKKKKKATLRLTHQAKPKLPSEHPELPPGESK